MVSGEKSLGAPFDFIGFKMVSWEIFSLRDTWWTIGIWMCSNNWGDMSDIASGNDSHTYWTWPFTVNVPIKNGDFP